MFSKLTWLWRLLPWQLGASCPRFIRYLKSSSLIFALWWQSTTSSDTTWLTRQPLCRFWRKVTKSSGLACSRCLMCSPRKEWTIVRNCPNTTTGKEDVIVSILYSVTLSSKCQLLIVHHPWNKRELFFVVVIVVVVSLPEMMPFAYGKLFQLLFGKSPPSTISQIKTLLRTRSFTPGCEIYTRMDFLLEKVASIASFQKAFRPSTSSFTFLPA